MTLPKDLAAFTRNGDQAEMCVFCAQPHQHMPVYQYIGAPDASSGMITGAHCCDSCFYDVDKMEKAFVGLSVRTSLFSDESWSTTKKQLEYVEHAHFDETVHMCYQHVIEEGLAPFRDNCYFCQLAVEGKPEYFIEVPVDRSNRMTGGHVRVCAACKFSMESEKIGFDVERWSTLKTPSDICERCKHVYLLTHDEYQNRVFVGNLGRHHCPKCAYVRCTIHAGDALVPKNTNLTQRSQQVTCGYCGAPFRYDKTFAYSNTLLFLLKSKAICRRCTEHEHPPIYATSTAQNFYRIFKYKEDVYIISRLKLSTEKETTWHVQGRDIHSMISTILADEN